MGTLNAPDGPLVQKAGIAASPPCVPARPNLAGISFWQIEPFRPGPDLSSKGAAMTQADHYRDQSNRAKRLAQAVNDPEASKKLAEMAEEFRLYAERLEQTH
jgi:hypothetical protein